MTSSSERTSGSASSAARHLARGWASRVELVSIRAKNTLGLRALLVRPDGVVAWLADGIPDLGLAEGALTRWFGAREELA